MNVSEIKELMSAFDNSKIGKFCFEADGCMIEMEKQGFTFWLYQDRDAKQMQLVFKRMDNTYGLLQPVKSR